MRRKTEEPTRGHVDRDGHELRHRAYGQLSVSRVHGGGDVLYGSDFEHETVMRLELTESSLRRSSGHDRPHAGKVIAQVDLSVHQWSQVISSVNAGEGTQVTLRAVRDGTLAQVPGLPLRDAGAPEYARDAEELLRSTLAGLDDLRVKVEGMRLTRAQRDEILEGVGRTRRGLADALPSLLDGVRRHMEGTVAAARSDLLAWASAVSTRMGLGPTAAPPPTIPDGGAAPRALPTHGRTTAAPRQDDGP